MKQNYALSITTKKDWQPTTDEIMEAIHSVINRKIYDTPRDHIPRKHEVKIELGSDFSKRA